MTADNLYDLIINFIAKNYRIVLNRTDVNICSGSIWLLLTKEKGNWNNYYYMLWWDDPDIPRDRHKWDHEMDIDKYDY